MCEGFKGSTILSPPTNHSGCFGTDEVTQISLISHLKPCCGLPAAQLSFIPTKRTAHSSCGDVAVDSLERSTKVKRGQRPISLEQERTSS